MTTYYGDSKIDLQRLARKLNIRLDVLVRRTAMAAFAGVTAKSPVDTGRFKASWNVRREKPDPSVKPEGKHNVTPVNVPSPEGNVDLAPREKATAVFVTNNLDYGPSLENGHSKQAPKGMVAVTILELRSEIEKMEDMLDDL